MDLHSESDRLRKLGVKISLNTIGVLELDMPGKSGNEPYYARILQPRTEIPIFEKTTARWVQSDL